VEWLFDSETIKQSSSATFSQPLALHQQDQPTIRSSLLAVAATGLGKTVLMAGIVRHWPVGRVMMISHRYELNTQAIRTFEDLCGEDVDLEQASYFADRRSNPHRIVVASVQTLNSRHKGNYRMERFNPMEFGLLMIDEAHRSAAESYRRVVQYFQRGNPNLKVLGVTATPDRLDGVGLGCVFEETICDLNIQWAVKNGWLVEPRQVIVELEALDLREVKTVGGDLDNKQLAKVVEMEKNLHGMAKPIVDFAGRDKQTIVFAASVAHSQRLAELIRDYYQRTHGEVNADTAVAIDGSMNPQDPRRKEIISRFKSGEIQFLCNCGVLTEGFDSPDVRLIAIGRPTKSRAMYIQMLGRGTRPLPGTVEDPIDAPARIAAIKASAKAQCDVLDFVGQSGRHSLVCTTDILAGDEPEEVRDRANKISSGKEFSGTTLDAIKQAKEQLQAEREARRHKVTVGVKYRASESNRFTQSTAITEKLVKPGIVSEKQAKFLLKLGFTQAEIECCVTRGHVQKLFIAAEKSPRNSFAKWWVEQKAKEKATV
jgi:superfamily II DNA or RNA helicase